MGLTNKNCEESEVDLMPDGWKTKKLGQLVRKFVNGGTPTTLKKEYWTGSIPWISGADVVGQKVNIIRRFITKDAVENSSTNIIQKGNLLVVSRTGVGKFAIAPFDVAISQDLTGIYTDESTLLPEYLFRYLDFNQKALHIQNQGTSIQGITRETLSEIRISLPDTSEQTAIATALSDTDALIENLEKLIAKKRNIKQGVMQELLTGRKRLAGFSTEWRYSTLSKFVADKKFAIVDGPFGSQMKVQDFVEQGIPIVEMEHLKIKFLEPDKLDRYITHKKFEELIRSSVFPDDIIISKTGSLGYISIVPNEIEKALITSRLAKITLDKKKANISFVFQCLTRLREIEYWQRTAQGGTMLILSIANISHAPIPDISIYEQKEIADILDTMDNDIERLEQILYKYNMIKHGMMQALLTGKIRLI
jgi:type I restriction enzyme S subunit